MGAYFAIPSSVDINTLGLTAEGSYVTDATSGSVVFYVEPTAPSSFVNNP